MAADTNLAGQTSASEIVITRVFDAPRALVFKAWTEPAHLKRWWAPEGFTTPHYTVDLRPGGRMHYCMRSPEGSDYWGLGTFREIVVPERLVYIDSFADAQGNPVPPAHYGISASHPAETLVTVTFTERAGRTTLTLRYAVPATVPERDMAAQGWNQMLDKLAGLLARA
ncbi:MAG: SRPBCC domain-containing protein [Candidatus Lambdaproteobacteria bacterium]|nr:SRPBCC domain-containing protein [Candidatus Lambdaproteobacteria bacterium]